MEFLFQGLSQESLWLVVVFYDLLLVVVLYKFFGKYGLYTAVILGIILGNLQGGKVSEFVIFDATPEIEVVFKGDEAADFQSVAAAMAAIQSVGIAKIGIVTSGYDD